MFRAPHLFVVAGLLSCAGSDATPASAPSGGGASADARAAAKIVTEEWYVQGVDRDAATRVVGIAMEANAPKIAFVPSGATHVATIAPSGAGAAWTARIGGNGMGTVVAYASSIDGKMSALHVVSGPSGQRLLAFRPLGAAGTAHAMVPNGDVTEASLGHDAGVLPHACIVTGGKLRYAAQDDDGQWSAADIAQARQCSVGAGGALASWWPQVAYRASSGAVSVATKTPAGWKTILLSESGSAPFAARTANGTSVVYGAEQRIVVARPAADGWAQEDLGPDVPALRLGEILRVAAAYGGTKLRVVAVVRDADKYAIKSVADTAGGFAVSTIADGFVDPPEPALVLDASGTPHVAFTDDTKRVLYARLRASGDSGRFDARGVATGCAAQIAREVGARAEATDLAATEKQRRDCDWLRDPIGPTRATLGAACDAGDANACVLAGLRDAPKGAVGDLHVQMRVAPCDGKNGTGADCKYLLRTVTALASLKEPGNDAAAAAKRLDRACEGGSIAGCLFRGEVAEQQADPAGAAKAYGKACAGDLVEACGALVASAADTTAFPAVRARLAEGCKAKRATACNLHAFMQERALGGPGEDSTAAHVAACELGATSSCVRLIVGPALASWRRRPPTPKLSPDELAEGLALECEAHDDADACLAVGLAFESGWVVARDASKAKERFGIACDHGSKTACARGGKKPPSR